VCEEPSFRELEWARKIASEMRWKGEFVVLPVEHTRARLEAERIATPFS
jgi:hypothetical protein